MWQKIKKTISKMFRHKPRKHFHFKDHKYGSWVSIYNSYNGSMETCDRKYSEYVDAIAHAWERAYNDRFNSSLKEAVYIYKKHRHDMHNGKKRFFFYTEHFEEQ